MCLIIIYEPAHKTIAPCPHIAQYHVPETVHLASFISVASTRPVVSLVPLLHMSGSYLSCV